MSAPASHDLIVYAGDSYSLELTFQDGAGAAFDLTGRTFSAQVRRWATDTAAPVAFAIAVGGAANKRLLSLTAAQTATLGEHGVWDFQSTRTSDSYVETWLAGKVTVNTDVTR